MGAKATGKSTKNMDPSQYPHVSWLVAPPPQKGCCLKAKAGSSLRVLGCGGPSLNHTDTQIQHTPLLHMDLVLLPSWKSALCEQCNRKKMHLFLAPLWGGLIFGSILSV